VGKAATIAGRHAGPGSVFDGKISGKIDPRAVRGRNRRPQVIDILSVGKTIP
jgi:hypothetical protein